MTDTKNGDSFFDFFKSDPGLYLKEDVQNLEVVMDRISALPDDVRVSIVSLLPLNEAAATSVLSRQWRHIWTFVTTIDLHRDILFHLRPYKPEKIESELDRYLNWVNSVMKQHRGHRINLLRVYANLDDPKYRSSISTWGRFVWEKRVQNFDLVLAKNISFSKRGGNKIKAVFGTFPSSHQSVYVDRSESELCSKHDILHPCLYTCSREFNCFRYLRVVEFRFVRGLTGKVLECLLSHSPNLERLTVLCTLGLDSFKVIGPSIALKYLHIHKHTGPVEIEICHVNLVSFIYGGGPMNLLLRNVPQLSEIFISSRRLSLRHCDSHQQQLEVLGLKGFVLNNEKHVLPTYVNLKHLELGLKDRDSTCVLQLISFMKASPYLHKLVLKLQSSISRNYTSEMEIMQAPKYLHQFLRVVEVTGYHGRTSDLELVRYLIENALELKELHMHPVRQWFSPERIRYRMGNREAVDRQEKEQRKQSTQQLKELVPSSLEFVCRL